MSLYLSNAGSNANTGTSELSPWATLEPLESAVTYAGYSYESGVLLGGALRGGRIYKTTRVTTYDWWSEYEQYSPGDIVSVDMTTSAYNYICIQSAIGKIWHEEQGHWVEEVGHWDEELQQWVVDVPGYYQVDVPAYWEDTGQDPGNTAYWTRIAGSHQVYGDSFWTDFATRFLEQVLGPGDSIYFRGGDTFGGTSFEGFSGASGSLINLQSYGTGQAKISTAESISLTLHSGHIYSCSLGGSCGESEYAFYKAGLPIYFRLYKRSGESTADVLSRMDRNGQWYLDAAAGVAYFYDDGTATGYTGGKSHGFEFYYCSFLEVKNLVFERVPGEAIKTWGSRVKVSSSCVFRYCGGSCVSGGSDNSSYHALLEVLDCTFASCGCNGKASSLVNIFCGSLTFRGNIASSAYYNSNGDFTGVSVTGSTTQAALIAQMAVLIEESTIAGCGGHAVVVFGGSASVESIGQFTARRNTLKRNGQNGVFVYRAYSPSYFALVHHNLIYDNGYSTFLAKKDFSTLPAEFSELYGHGINIVESRRVQTHNNTVVFNSHDGISVDGTSSYVDLANNLTFGNRNELVLGSYPVPVGPSNQITVDHNAFWGDGTRSRRQYEGYPYLINGIGYNDLAALKGAGLDISIDVSINESVWTCPKFLDVANQLFGLRSSSAYLTGGANLGYTEDLNGTAIGANRSLGAIQFVSPGTDVQPVYYLDPTKSDSNDGRTEANAWASLEPVNMRHFAPDASILFKKGASLAGSINLRVRGGVSDTIRLSLGSYGTGDEPVIEGGVSVLGFDSVAACYLAEKDFVSIGAVKAHGANDIGFLVSDSKGISLDGTLTEDTQLAGVLVEDGSEVDIDGAQILNPSIGSVSGAGILVRKSKTNITGSVIGYDGTQGWTDPWAWASFGRKDLVRYEGACSGECFDNDLYGAMHSAIVFDRAHYSQVKAYGNRLHDCAWHGIEVIDTQSIGGLVAYANIIYGCGRKGSVLTLGAGICVHGISSGLSAHNNLILDCTNGVWSESRESNLLNNMVVDPLNFAAVLIGQSGVGLVSDYNDYYRAAGVANTTPTIPAYSGSESVLVGEYRTSGSIYRCIKGTPGGISPTDPDHWELVMPESSMYQAGDCLLYGTTRRTYAELTSGAVFIAHGIEEYSVSIDPVLVDYKPTAVQLRDKGQFVPSFTEDLDGNTLRIDNAPIGPYRGPAISITDGFWRPEGFAYLRKSADVSKLIPTTRVIKYRNSEYFLPDETIVHDQDMVLTRELERRVNSYQYDETTDTLLTDQELLLDLEGAVVPDGTRVYQRNADHLLLEHKGNDAADWEFWRYGYGGAGRTTCIAACPTDSTILLVGSDVAGYFKSKDGGQTWTNRAREMRGFNVSCIVFDPTDSSRVFILSDFGLYVSLDQGDSVELLSDLIRYPGRLFGMHLMCVAGGALWVCTDSDPGSTTLPASGKNLFRVELSDLTFSKVNEDEFSAKLTSVAHQAGFIYLATESGVIRFDIDNEVFSAWNTGLESPNIQDIYASPTALMAVDREHGLIWYESGSWHYDTEEAYPPEFWDGMYDDADWNPEYKSLCVNPVNADQVWMCSHPESWPFSVYRTDDRGSSWNWLGGAAFYREDAPQGVFYQQNSPGRQVYDRNAYKLSGPECVLIVEDRLYLTDWANVWVSYDKGDYWLQIHRGLSEQVVFSSRQDPHDPSRAFICAADEGLMVSDNRGESWTRMMEGCGVIGGPAFDIVVSEGDPDLTYMLHKPWGSPSTHIHVFKSTDRCLTWVDVGFDVPALQDPPPQATQRAHNIVVHPSNNTVYVSTGGWGVWKSTNGGATWTQKSSGIVSLYANSEQSLVMHPDDPEALFLSCAIDGVYRSLNGGDSWSRISDAVCTSAGLPAGERHTTTLAIDPLGKDRLVVCAPKKKVLVASNILAADPDDITWTHADLPAGPWTSGVSDYEAWIENIPASGIAWSPTTSGMVVVGSGGYDYNAGDGIFVSLDAGLTWEAIENLQRCFPAQFIRHLRFEPNSNRVVASTACGLLLGVPQVTGVYSSEAVDLSPYRTVLVDWENTGADVPECESLLQVMGEWTKSVHASLMRSGPFPRRTDTIDISSLSVRGRIMVAARLNAGASGTEKSSLKVYGVWLSNEL